MTGTSNPNTQFLPAVPTPQHTLAARLGAMLTRLSAPDQATLQEAIVLVSTAQPAAYPP